MPLISAVGRGATNTPTGLTIDTGVSLIRTPYAEHRPPTVPAVGMVNRPPLGRLGVALFCVAGSQPSGNTPATSGRPQSNAGCGSAHGQDTFPDRRIPFPTVRLFGVGLGVAAGSAGDGVPGLSVEAAAVVRLRKP
jgi:hypothetical protein